MTEYQTHAALVATLETEIVRLRAVNAELNGIIEAGIKPNNSLAQAARQALEALEPIHHGNMTPMAEFAWKDAITALREALEAQEPWTPDDMAYRPGGLSQHVTDDHQVFKLGYAKGVDDAERRAKARGEQPAAPTQDPAAWAITYDGRTPHTLWHEGDGPLLDLEIKRQGGSAQKMALYTAPQPAAVEQEPVLVVEREPSYMDRGHFYKGDKPHIDPTKVWKLPIGTKLYTAPPPAAVEQEPVAYLYCGGQFGGELAEWEIDPEQRQCDKLNEHFGALGKEARIPLFTAPQPTRQAARQPLDEGKLKAMWVQNAPHIGAPLEFARAIEKAHGIGGEA